MIVTTERCTRSEETIGGDRPSPCRAPICDRDRARSRDIAAAEDLIDLGYEGGLEGGQLIAQGTPEQVAKVEASDTGKFLRKMLRG